MAKLKARDLIPSWPRGRSTTVSWENEKYRFRNDFFPWGVQGTDEYGRDLEADAKYHQKQQELVNNKFRNSHG
jgi:hypothetical protein